MNRLVIALGLGAFIAPGAEGQAPKADSLGFISVSAETLKWPESGNQMVLAGDPTKPGIYVIRVRFAPGQYSRPHIHDQDRFVTVIKGTWWVALGPGAAAFDTARTTPMKTGSMVKHPAGGIHFDGAKDEETIVQIIGMGPVTTTRINPDGSPERRP